MNVSILNETRAVTARDLHNSSFENHMNLYASYNVQEAAQRTRLFSQVQSDEPARNRNAAPWLHSAALVFMISSLLTVLFNQFVLQMHH